MATLREVAHAAGVSKSVASRALNNDTSARVAAETRRRVLAAAEKLAYVPDHRALALRTGRSEAIALIVPEVSNSVFSELFEGVHQAAAAESCSVLLGQFYDDEGKSYPLARVVDQGRVDGVVLQRRETVNDDTLARMIDVNAPVVLFNSKLRGTPGSVTLDDARAVGIATQHLLELGHARIGLIGGRHVHDAARRRLAGYRAAMKAAGKTAHPHLIVEAGWEAPAGAEAMDALLSSRRPPTGIVVASVNAALGALSRAVAAGLEVPKELSIVAIQDTWLARLITPPLTVVKMPLREAGAIAAAMLLARINGGELRDVVVTDPPPQLIVRDSTAAPP